MRRARALLAALLVAGLAPAAAGCGLGEGNERAGGGATCASRATSATRSSARRSLDSVREGQTVMRMLRSEFDVNTRFGGRFVQSIDGVQGQGAGGQVDWFFWVNGVEADKGAAEWEVLPGDRIQWDHRDWSAAMRVPAIVGAFPEPFATGSRASGGRFAWSASEVGSRRVRRTRASGSRRGRVHLRLLARRARAPRR